MLSLVLRRVLAAVPALLGLALAAGVVAALAGPGWAPALGAALAALPATLALILPALALGTGLGALLGVLGGSGAILGGVGPAMPGFLLAAVFAVTSATAPVLLGVAAVALPATAQAAVLAGRARAGAEDTVLLAARGRGVDGSALLWRLSLPLGLSAAVGGLRSAVAGTVTAAVAVESLFGTGFSGAGRLFVEAARAGDASMAVAALAGLCGLAVLLNALCGALHGWIDPRARMA
ncbi:osmoprotectant transport system permease protein/oligopeptide transport system permease protein [Azospirillum brasilense]|uniref:Osmoprotectant transport system permease protein/oligopeptide transport system permease protein n=1 Tax=Azospirillum brasilense TaxID=192 RepID=A0A560CH24_AZOBR|nr:ABC transporter permease subunit [Azospirillum brasilense]TWA84150.1 osmoprotectant transport system permease protein/oligopeptide transport system permease protein [Azospirillum brasilense]